MATQIAQNEVESKKHLTRTQSIVLMVLGAAMILVPWLVKVEPGSPLYLAKVLVGLVGFVSLCVGSYYRP
jgi:hypothetical protein